MKRSDLLRAALATFLVTIPLSVTGHADEPLPLPTRETIWSANRRFFAVMDPDNQITTIYRTTSRRQGEKVWSMYGWFRGASLTDDGEHLVAGYAGMELIPHRYSKQQVMLYFFKRGELINHVTLDQIIYDYSKLQRTASHYYWGSFSGLDKDGRYVVKTVEGRTIRFDVTNGRPVP